MLLFYFGYHPQLVCLWFISNQINLYTHRERERTKKKKKKTHNFTHCECWLVKRVRNTPCSCPNRLHAITHVASRRPKRYTDPLLGQRFFTSFILIFIWLIIDYYFWLQCKSQFYFISLNFMAISHLITTWSKILWFELIVMDSLLHVVVTKKNCTTNNVGDGIIDGTYRS